VEKLKKEMIPELEAKTAHLSVEGQAGQAVFVDGEKIGVAPINDQVHVAPGEHTVACGTITKTVVVKAGDTATVIVVVREVVPAPSASASVAPPPSASAAPPPVPSASASAKPPEVPVGPPKGEEHRTTMGWVAPISLVGVGIGGVVAGAVFNSAASDKHNEGVQARGGQNCTGSTSPGCQQAAKAAQDEQSDKNLSTAMFVGGGAMIVGGVVAFLLWPKESSSSRTSYVTPIVGKGGVGLVYGTSF
jgi:hypothetical protein